jgi:hypothetical protein
MTLKRIGLHEFYYCNTKAIISTVQLSDNEFETMAMFEDGDELECVRTHDAKTAAKKHNEIMHKWNDKIYEGSTAKLLGADNYGQFVKTIVAC